MRLKISSFKRVVALTGAGISAESGISTFRDSNGLWERHRIEDVATPESFDRNPGLVWRFYSMRRRDAAKVTPNDAHLALARFARQAPSRGLAFTLITQNVDMLHERAAALVADKTQPIESRSPLQLPTSVATDRAKSRTLSIDLPLAMHGTLSCSRCAKCEQIFQDPHTWLDENGASNPKLLELELPTPPLKAEQPPATLNLDTIARSNDGLPLAPCCKGALLRPHIVWFGERPLYMEQIETALSSADLFVTIGTSGQVYPAAGFLEQAKFAGIKTACLNKEALPQQAMIDFYFDGPATKTVPALFQLGT